MARRRHKDVAVPLKVGEHAIELAPDGKYLLVKTDHGRIFRVRKAKSGRYLLREAARG